MKTDKKQQEKIKPRIAIFYQGEEAKGYRQHIVEKLLECGAEPDEAIFNKKGHDDDVSFNKRVICLLSECDGAIALLTKDKRAASAYGNLWLEVGLWIGLKSSKTIRIFQEEQPDDWDVSKDGEWPVKLPSNMGWGNSPTFKTEDRLSELVIEFVEKIRGFLRPFSINGAHTEKGIYIDELKIKHILMNDNSVWEPSELHLCQNRDEKYECHYRKETIGLLCEFFRMREYGWVHWLTEACFHRLSHLCKVAVLTDYMGNIPILRAEQRQIAIDEIHEIVHLLGVTAEKFLKWPAGADVTARNKWEKLRVFLVYRLNLCYYLRERCASDDTARATYEENVKYFCSWAEELSKNDYTTNSYYYDGFEPFGVGNTASQQMAGRFQKCHRIARDISKSLALLGSEFFSECGDVIKESIDKLTDSEGITNSLKKIRRSFPQNQHESKLPRIWPISEMDNEIQKLSAGIK